MLPHADVDPTFLDTGTDHGVHRVCQHLPNDEEADTFFAAELVDILILSFSEGRTLPRNQHCVWLLRNQK